MIRGSVLLILAFSVGVALALGAMFLLLFLVVGRLDREPGFRALQFGALAGGVSILLVMLQDQVFWPALSLSLGNAAGVASLLLLWTGLRLRLQQPRLGLAWWFLPILMALLGFWFSAVQPSLVARISVFNALLLLPVIGLGVLFWRASASPAEHGLLRGAALLSALMVFFTLGRLGMVVHQGVSTDRLLELAPTHAWLLKGQMACLLAVVMMIITLLVTGLVEKLRNQASLDPLTGLLNRLGFRTQVDGLLDGSSSPHSSAALMMLDLDRFKRINDTYGHDVGDEVLKRLADIMKTAAGPNDCPMRLGGEEFALLSFSGDPLAQAERLREAFAEPPDQLPACTVSIGLAVDVRLDEKGLRDAFRLADTALYAAKDKGRNRTEVVQVHAPSPCPVPPER